MDPKFKKGDIVYWWGERCEVIDGPKWPLANPRVPPEFEDPSATVHPGPRHYLYGDKPDRRTTEWRLKDPAYLIRRASGHMQYILQSGLTKDDRESKRHANFLAAVIEQYTLLSKYLSREEHTRFLNMVRKDVKRARKYLAKKGVPPKETDKAMRLSLKMNQ
jgi:hypothetical protein